MTIQKEFSSSDSYQFGLLFNIFIFQSHSKLKLFLDLFNVKEDSFKEISSYCLLEIYKYINYDFLSLSLLNICNGNQYLTNITIEATELTNHNIDSGNIFKFGHKSNMHVAVALKFKQKTDTLRKSFFKMTF